VEKHMEDRVLVWWGSSRRVSGAPTFAETHCGPIYQCRPVRKSGIRELRDSQKSGI